MKFHVVIRLCDHCGNIIKDGRKTEAGRPLCVPCQRLLEKSGHLRGVPAAPL